MRKPFVINGAILLLVGWIVQAWRISELAICKASGQPFIQGAGMTTIECAKIQQLAYLGYGMVIVGAVLFLVGLLQKEPAKPKRKKRR